MNNEEPTALDKDGGSADRPSRRAMPLIVEDNVESVENMSDDDNIKRRRKKSDHASLRIVKQTSAINYESESDVSIYIENTDEENESSGDELPENALDYAPT